jgi:hypothetical protein
VSSPASRDIRLVVLVCLALVVLSSAVTVAPAAAADRTDEAAALRLLERAADAARTVGYAGTQYVASWSATGSSSTLADIAHDPVQGTVVTRPSSAGPSVELVSSDRGPAALERQLLDVLARSYALRVAGTAQCAGRTADLVEVQRPGGRGKGALAGRFWLDRETGLLLRREVYDGAGRTVTSSAFLDLVLVPPSASAAVDEQRGAAPAEPAALRARSAQWQAPQRLPGGFTLFDAQLRDGERRVHLSYSDGLSTLSLFAQRGRIGDGPDGAFSRTSIDGSTVWTSSTVPQRVVWSGGGQVWTLVSDAPADAVRAAVVALPHDPPPDDGVLARLGRGLKRMGGMLNPFG